MIDAPHGFTLTTTAEPRTESRPRPLLTVERAPRVLFAPRNLPYSGVTLEPAEDEDSDFLAERRATFVRESTRAHAAFVADLWPRVMEGIARMERSYKFAPRAGRAEKVARERAAHIETAEQYIAERQAKLDTAITFQPILRSPGADTRAPNVYVCATDGLALRMAMVEGVGPTVEVRVAGDPALQQQVYSFLCALQVERESLHVERADRVLAEVEALEPEPLLSLVTTGAGGE